MNRVSWITTPPLSELWERKTGTEESSVGHRNLTYSGKGASSE